MANKKRYARTVHNGGWIGMLENEEQYEGLKSGKLSFKEHIRGNMKAIQIPPELFFRLMELDKAVTAIPFEIECYPRVNVGDSVYFPIKDIDGWFVSKETVTDTSVKGFFTEGGCEPHLYASLGRTVFLNPEDAEKYYENTDRDYDFDETCPHCDFVNEVKWDGKSKTITCAGCGKKILLCNNCEKMPCGACLYEKELKESEGGVDNG